MRPQALTVHSYSIGIQGKSPSSVQPSGRQMCCVDLQEVLQCQPFLPHAAWEVPSVPITELLANDRLCVHPQGPKVHI